jgi:hypothetical protein
MVDRLCDVKAGWRNVHAEANETNLQRAPGASAGVAPIMASSEQFPSGQVGVHLSSNSTLPR